MTTTTTTTLSTAGRSNNNNNNNNNDLEDDETGALSGRLEELREEKRLLEKSKEKIIGRKMMYKMLTTLGVDEDGMTPEKRKKEYDENNFPEAIIENIERDLGHGARAQRGPEEPANHGVGEIEMLERCRGTVVAVRCREGRKITTAT